MDSENDYSLKEIKIPFIVVLGGSIAINLGLQFLTEAIVTAWDNDEQTFKVENISTENFLEVALVAVATAAVWEVGTLGVNEYIRYSKKQASRRYLVKNKGIEMEEEGVFYDRLDPAFR